MDKSSQLSLLLATLLLTRPFGSGNRQGANSPGIGQTVQPPPSSIDRGICSRLVTTSGGQQFCCTLQAGADNPPLPFLFQPIEKAVQVRQSDELDGSLIAVGGCAIVRDSSAMDRLLQA